MPVDATGPPAPWVSSVYCERMKRLALVLAAAVVSVAGCSASTDDSADEPSPSATTSSSTPAVEPTALSQDGGTDVWDLSAAPTREGFGIVPRGENADYSSTTRPVRFVVGDDAFEVDLKDLTFYATQGDSFAFLARTDELAPGDLTAAYRGALEQLGVDDATADTFEAELEDAPTDEPGNVSISYPDEIRLGDWTFAVGAAISPAAGTGVVTLSGGHRPQPTA